MENGLETRRIRISSGMISKVVDERLPTPPRRCSRGGGCKEHARCYRQPTDNLVDQTGRGKGGVADVASMAISLQKSESGPRFPSYWDPFLLQLIIHLYYSHLI